MYSCKKLKKDIFLKGIMKATKVCMRFAGEVAENTKVCYLFAEVVT